jgi:hypothetical protein
MVLQCRYEIDECRITRNAGLKRVSTKVSFTPLAGIDGKAREWLHTMRTIVVLKAWLSLGRDLSFGQLVQLAVALFAQNMSQNKTSR